jgi:hypothetical protein
MNKINYELKNRDARGVIIRGDWDGFANFFCKIEKQPADNNSDNEFVLNINGGQVECNIKMNGPIEREYFKQTLQLILQHLD